MPVQSAKRIENPNQPESIPGARQRLPNDIVRYPAGDWRVGNWQLHQYQWILSTIQIRPELHHTYPAPTTRCPVQTLDPGQARRDPSDPSRVAVQTSHAPMPPPLFVPG